MRKRFTWMALAVVALGITVTAHADMMGDGGGMMGMQPTVAPDGTVLVLRPAIASSSGASTGIELVAIAPAGTELWHWGAGAGIHDVSLLGNLVVASTGTGMGGGRMMGGGDTTEIVALQLANGVEVWRLAIDGMAGELSPAGDRVYALARKAQTTTTGGGMHGSGQIRGGTSGPMGGTGGAYGMSGTFTLYAIGLNGKVLWSLPLSK